ncbi:hypothetical protein PR202_gb16046 [Eleusine coracana subsp. coracana]|uniref:Reverse transcriptase zinc-binding domain-containing protein n=1 Tax=Eleusine coracana subsp. coracana TaxID=191504 RepID=A0AAV5EX36_ELECO|nr:hypothetical protein PR202_gb16046 [Eleusine coracana subsp. coracana]
MGHHPRLHRHAGRGLICLENGQFGSFSSKSAYQAFFQGAITFEPWRRIWRSWAPSKCKVFLWLAVRDRCWTADRLTKRNLPHPDKCPFCDQADETVQHLLTSCVFARECWFKVLAPLGFSSVVPRNHNHKFSDWWRRAVKKVPKARRKGFNSVVILVAWLLWKHRNACVFEGSSPDLRSILRSYDTEHHLWCIAGVKGLASLGRSELTG